MIRLLLICFMAFSAPVAAQNATDDIGNLLRSLHLDPAFRQSLRERGYTGPKFDIMIDHTRKLYSDKAIIAGIARKIDAGLRASGNKPSKAFFQQLDSALGQAYNVGMTRLSSGERKRMFAIDFGFIKALPAKECTRLLTGKLRGDRTGALFDAYMVQLPANHIADYHSLARKATRLGLAANASPRNLSAADTRRVEEALFPRIDDLIGKQPNAKALYKAWSRGPTASSRYTCTFNLLFGSAALGLQGKTGDLAILYLLAQ